MFPPVIVQPSNGPLHFYSGLNDQTTFTALLRSVYAAAERYTRHLCLSTSSAIYSANDLLQEALARAWKQFPRLRHHQNFRGWFFRIIHNTHIECLRRNRRHQVDYHDFADTSPYDLSTPGSLTQPPSAQDIMEMRQALRQLNRKELQVLLLYTLGGYTISELSVMQKCTIPCMKKRLERAREKMRRQLDEVTGMLIFPNFSGDIIDETLKCIDEVAWDRMLAATGI